MKLSRMWLLRGRPGAEGTENPEWEATLREAMTEPAAPGEDASYRRLMGVIADDMRLRRPAPQRRPWAWVPALSASATAAILLVFAYTAGVDQGRRMAQDTAPPVTGETRTGDAVVPHGQYSPPKVAQTPPPAAEKPRPSINVEELPEPSPMNYIGNLLLDGLSKEQRELVRLYNEQAKEGHWENAARTLEDLADVDPSSEAAIKALHGAAVIQQSRVRNDAEALRLFQREADALERQLTAAENPEHRAALEKQRELAETSIGALSPSAE